MTKKVQKTVIITVLMITVFTSGVFASGSTLISEFINSLMVKIGVILPNNTTEAADTLNTESDKIITDLTQYNQNYENAVSSEVTRFKDDYTSLKVQELKDIQSQYQQEMDSRKQTIVTDITNDLKTNIDKEYQKALDKMQRELTK